jgi:hypothetical protein
LARECWIVVRNWGRFQHYKHRQPPWIKNYTELMSDDAYRSLPLGTRGVLHGLWMEYARGRRLLRGDSRSVSRALGQRVLTAQLEALNQAGFIDLVASKPGASDTRVGVEGLRPEEDLRPEEPTGERKQKPAQPPAETPSPNEVRDRAFRAYRSHGGNLTLEKERNVLARSVTSLLDEGVDANAIIAAAGDLGRERSFPGYLKQRVKELTENGGPCKHRGLDRTKMTAAELRSCNCKRCQDWVTALETQERGAA